MNEEVRAPNYELAENDYMNGMKYKDIAAKYNVTINTVKSWKQRYDWSKDKKKSVHTKDKKVCTQKKVGAPLGNKNAVGNDGGAPAENKNAEKHGFFAKWLPEETFEIFQEIQQKDPLDILWDNIMLQYTAIVRAQKIMFVKDQQDKTVEKIEEKDGNVCGERWEVHQAWDKHATFIKAQSRAMGELRSMIKQYEELCKSNLTTEEQRQRINLIKTQISKLSGSDNKDELQKLDEVLAQIKGVV